MSDLQIHQAHQSDSVQMEAREQRERESEHSRGKTKSEQEMKREREITSGGEAWSRGVRGEMSYGARNGKKGEGVWRSRGEAKWKR